MGISLSEVLPERRYVKEFFLGCCYLSVIFFCLFVEDCGPPSASQVYEWGRIGEVDLLLEALKDPRVRWQAAKALGNSKDPRAVTPLCRVLADESYLVRFYATEALGKIAKSSAAKALLKRLDDDHPRVRAAAANSLAELGEGQIPLLLRELSTDNLRLREGIINVLERLQNHSLTPLVLSLEHEDRKIRAEVVIALGRIQSPQATVPLLEKLLQEQDVDMQAKIVWALGEIEDPRALGVLTQISRSSHNKQVGELARQAALKIAGKYSPLNQRKEK